jgi:hypothetical protein
MPFVARNIFLTGLPFYPSSFFNWFVADWKADPVKTENLLEYIKYYNRVPTTYYTIDQTKALGANWIPSWFRYLFIYDKILVLAGAAGILAGFTIQVFKKKNYNKLVTIFMAVLMLWLICWLIISPDPRFVYGSLLAGSLIAAHTVLSLFRFNNFYKPFFKILMLLFLIASACYFIYKPIRQTEYRNWLGPAKLPEPPVKEIIIDGISFRIPEPLNNNWNARCYGTELPCLYTIDKRLNLRGKNISDGFRLEK